MLDSLHIEDFNNTSHPSYFLQTQEYGMLIVRLPKLDTHRLDAKNYNYVIKNDTIYSYVDAQLQLLPNGFIDLYEKLDSAIDHTTLLLEGYMDHVTLLEEKIFSKSIEKNFINYWFELKKDLSRIERIYIRAYNALRIFIKTYEKENFFNKESFLDLEEHLDRNARNVSLALSKLDTVYTYYESIKNDRLNATLYTLTLISAIFLPLNLVVGFFGMNTTDLFFTEESHGTMSVIFVLTAIVIAIVIAVPLLIKIYKMSFGKFLNRYEFYKKITKKLL